MSETLKLLWCLIIPKLSPLCLGAFTHLPGDQTLRSLAGSSRWCLNGHKLQLIHLPRWSLEARIEAHVRDVDKGFKFPGLSARHLPSELQCSFYEVSEMLVPILQLKSCYDIIFPKLPIQEPSLSESWVVCLQGTNYLLHVASHPVEEYA